MPDSWKPNLYTDDGLHAIAGMRIVASEHLTEPCEDFSRSRSPSRALRRWRRRGILGRGALTRPARKAMQMDGVLYMHPLMIAALNGQLAARRDRALLHTIGAPDALPG